MNKFKMCVCEKYRSDRWNCRINKKGSLMIFTERKQQLNQHLRRMCLKQWIGNKSRYCGDDHIVSTSKNHINLNKLQFYLLNIMLPCLETWDRLLSYLKFLKFEVPQVSSFNMSWKTCSKFIFHIKLAVVDRY